MLSVGLFIRGFESYCPTFASLRLYVAALFGE